MLTMASPNPIDQQYATTAPADKATPETERIPHIDQSAGEIGQTTYTNGDPYQDERNERERRDIVAQEEMADWAKAAFWATLASASIAGLALFAIGVDIYFGRKRAQIDQRPWLTFRAELERPVQLTEDGLKFRFYIVVKNVGSTPAINATLKGKMFNMLRGGTAAEEFISDCVKQAKSKDSAKFILGPNEEAKKFYQMSLSKNDFGVLAGRKDQSTYPMAVFSVCYSAASDSKLLAHTAKGFLYHLDDWVSGQMKFGSIEIEELGGGEAYNIGLAT
mgnify:CR=1 FL=1|tara:strand:- start:15507 stop:16337 length:831 start_codon:yes stop_codon:yes gene_type:complete